MLDVKEGSYALGGRWRGLDRSQQAGDLLPGALQACDNFVLDGDDLLTRPGADSQLTSALGAALRAFTPFDAGALFVSGGKLYYWVAGATSATEILKGGSSLSLVSNSVQVAQAVGVGFLVDGTSPLIRTTTSAASELTELDRPATFTEATVTHRTLVSLAARTWSQNYVEGDTDLPTTSGLSATIAPTSTITQADSNFWDGTSSEFVPRAFWTPTSGEPSFTGFTLTTNGDNCAHLDSNKYDTLGPDAVESALIRFGERVDGTYSPVAIVAYEAGARNTNATTEVVDLTVKAIDLLGSEIDAWRKTTRSPILPTTRALKIRELVDFRNVPASDDLHGFKLEFRQPHGRNSGAGAGVNRVAVYLPKMELSVSSDADNRLTVRQGSVQVWQGIGAAPAATGQASGLTDPATNPPGRLLTAGLKIESDSFTSANYSSVRTIGLEVLPGAGVSQLALRIGFYSGSTWHYSQVLDVPPGGGWATTDLAQLAASLTAVTKIAIEIMNDVIIEGLQEAGTSTIFRLGELRSVGNLPEGLPVWYKLVEMDDAGDSSLLDVVWSDGSDSSPLVEATAGSRMARLKLPARTNSAAEWLALYRFGGRYTPTDGRLAQGRLVAMISWAAADFAFGGDTDKGVSPRIVAFANPYVSWDKEVGSTGAAGSILIDNTPDSWLAGADFYVSGREQAPTGPASVAAWDNRLWLAEGSNLFASWVLDGGASAGVYWSRLQLPESDDPEAARKGHWERLSLSAGDSIQRMIPLPDYLIVLTKQRVYRVEKTQQVVPAYAALRLWADHAQGVVSPLAACELDGRVMWLTSSGLRSTDGLSVDIVGQELHYLLKSASSSDLAAARLSACPISRKVFLSLGSVLYVYHAGRDTLSEIERGWTSWSSLNSLLAADIGGVVHLAGESGQIWKMSGTQDDAGAISASLTTRRYGGGGVSLQPGRLSLHVVAAGSETLTITVTGDSPTLSAEVSQSLTAGEWDWSLDVPNSAEGRALDVTLEVAAGDPLRVKGIALEATQKRRI